MILDSMPALDIFSKKYALAFRHAIILVMMSFFLSGCQLGYLMQAADGQYKLISKKVSFKKVLEDPDVSDETKHKIKLVQEVKAFAEKNLSLVHSKNYESFVKLDDKYVTYVVTASPQNKIEPYLWNFPFVGRVPYKGYFKKASAEGEAAEMKKKDLDVMVRGVTAYSTLGWFSDPLLSSMLYDNEAELVETIIHETTHATIYIKSNAEFNERLATFVGHKGMEMFYLQKEGPLSPTLEKARMINHDADVFHEFMTRELKNLSEFYSKNENHPQLMELREKEFTALKEKFKKEVVPKLKTKIYNYFGEMKLNNAILLNYKIYYNNLKIFSDLYKSVGENWVAFFGRLEQVRNSKQPEADLEQSLYPK